MDLLQSVFNHAVLPPKIPGTEDADIDAISNDLLRRLIKACGTLQDLAEPPFSDVIKHLRGSLRACYSLNKGRLDRQTILEQFRQLQPHHTLILHVVEQNAALLVYRDDIHGADTVVFEAFETSPTSDKVLAADSALVWDFPGRSVRLPIETFSNISFQENLAIFLEHASMESLHSLQAQARKAKVTVAEVRDTASPDLIVNMLLPLVEALGEYVNVPRLRKRVRDDVNFQSGQLPWRRLPFWLILRVAAQRQLSLSLGQDGRFCYKLMMSIFFAGLLNDCTANLHPELLITLRSKLCRRMAKLEMEKSALTEGNRELLASWLFQSQALIKHSIQYATSHVEGSWETFKRKTIRRIHRLPLNASKDALRLTLANSGKYLDGLLNERPLLRPQTTSLDFLQSLDNSVQQAQNFTDRIFQIAAMESRIEHDQKKILNDQHCKTGCIQLASEIDGVFKAVGSLYDSDPTQMSIMVLTLFELWMRMDEYATTACPLLAKYCPIFTPELLDVLQLPTLSNMHRLQTIQTYLARRHKNSQFTNIFSDISGDCFAVRYAEESLELQELMTGIQNESEQSRKFKEAEWNQVSAKYDSLTMSINNGTCVCTWDDGRRNVRGCKKCWHWRTRKRLGMKIHEDFLPSDNTARNSIVFELAVPAYLSAYRNATWRLLRDLAHPGRETKTKSPLTRLEICSPLMGFMSVDASMISLASIKKCFKQTHYDFSKGKVPLSSILLPFAANFELFDHASGIWVKDLRNPLTLQHLCGIHIPQALSSTVIKLQKHPRPDMVGPSSYEIQANQLKCPSHVSVLEFSTFQKLLAGKVRRWPEILVEMGSTSLNFTNEDTILMLSQLAVQAGPCLEGEVLRAIHVTFRDSEFVQRLLEQIEKKLKTIESNWREVNCMELLVNLSLRVYSLSSEYLRDQAEGMLNLARSAMRMWIARLHEESNKTSDGGAADRLAMYGLRAALLCRRTFEIFAEPEPSMISSSDLTLWVQASVALQENLTVNIDKLPTNIKNMMVRDGKIAYHLEPLLRQAISTYPASVGEGIGSIWLHMAGDSTQNKLEWEFLPAPNSRWIIAKKTEMGGTFWVTQTISFCFTEGHLFINGKPRSKLPAEMRDSPSVQLLFGSHHLFTFNSPLPSMTHQLATTFEEQQVHFGMRNGQIVIRAVTKRGALLEFIPNSVFVGPNSFDLPASLLENCAHWLDLKTGLLEVRRSPGFWVHRPRNWIINIPKRYGHRDERSRLVDPASQEFDQITKIFENFELPNRITVFQPISDAGVLSVELRHLHLSFFVNKRGLLNCRELKAEIDPNQDAGTWYGLVSKIVLRDHVDQRKRTIIIPGGEVIWKRRDVHVSVHLEPDRRYFRFDIDDVLGRITCPPEPLQLYMKALCHAITSFCLPDPLTKRTGTDEAFHILRSGAAHPWAPITTSHSLLKKLASLLPQREYYPRNLKRLQRTKWDDDLTMTIQNDGFEDRIRSIEMTSNHLAQFATPPVAATTSLELPSQLRRRAQVRRQLYERLSEHNTPLSTVTQVYHPRDRNISPNGKTIFQITNSIHYSSPSIHMKRSLRDILESWRDIGGFHPKTTLTSSEPLISQIEDPIDIRWGDLVEFCRQARDQFVPIFRLALLGFAEKANIDILLSLAAFSYNAELKNLEPLTYSSFSEFKSRGPPSLEELQRSISDAYHPFEHKPLNGARTSEITARLQHMMQCEAQGKKLAKDLIKQWPVLKDFQLDAGDEVQDFIDVRSALKNIQLDWTRRQKNEELLVYVKKVDDILDRTGCSQTTRKLKEWQHKDPVFTGIEKRAAIPSLAKHLLVKTCIELNRTSASIPANNVFSKHERTANGHVTKIAPEVKELEEILQNFVTSSENLRQKYGQELLKSLTALKSNSHTTSHDQSFPLVERKEVDHAIKKANQLLASHAQSITSAFAAKDDRFEWLVLGNLWPCVSPVEILELLRSCSNHRYGKGMKEAIVAYGVLITEIQRLRRIGPALTRNETRILGEELRNCGHENWNPVNLTDWLLLEIDSNILIRADQVEVARAIIGPASGKNSVLQMNMGKGKTSCIMPMAAAILADGNNLSRLIVPKSLIMQTAQTIQARLGGLVGREICQIPFSRQTPTDEKTISLYINLHQTLQRTRGLILSCHGDLLSFKLGGLQRLADERLNEAKRMIGFQDWLNSHCRDVLDESDFTLSVKTQLNYPSGSEMLVDGHPYRWQVAEGLLSMVAHYVPILQQRFPTGIEVLTRSGWFPMTQILRRQVENELHNLILTDICRGKTPFLRPIKSISATFQKVIRQALSEEIFDGNLFDKAVCAFKHPESAAKKLLVVRGLIIHKILSLCLSKRWNVQYGLHPNRHPVAVPFEAKGVPSELSEFGHPDVAIVFTCISFYLSGLNPAQFHQSLQRVLTSEDPASEYEKWISESTALPPAFRHWNIVNLDDEGQMQELWRCLQKDRVVVDHYLNNFVFPLHARQFTLKLHASAWDLPILSMDPTRGARTTGFSGTNDNRTMLPLSIQQDDLHSLLQTNAEVLSYLLQSRNRGYWVTADQSGTRLTEYSLLMSINKMGIRILIDAGAYILEMENKVLAKMWLSIDKTAKAAVYFGSDNRAWVMFREDSIKDMPLLATPFANDFSECLVYLDEAHTRGVDLKLPENGRGALTLALKQTKDYTMQAAMRLRHLRTTQSLTFFAPPEVDQSIRDVCGLKNETIIDSSHVIFWLLEQTCRTNEDTQSLYVAQGVDFCKHTDARLSNPKFLSNSSIAKSY